MNVAAIIQARMGSSRLPGKVLMNLDGKSLLEHVIHRVQAIPSVRDILVATSEDPSDDLLAEWCHQRNIHVVRGAVHNVLQRFAQAANQTDAEWILRVTADDPFKDPQLAEQAITYARTGLYDVVCNVLPPSYPEGLDVELMRKKSLQLAAQQSQDAYEQEHVTQYFYRHPETFRLYNMQTPDHQNYSALRVTLDTEPDFLLCQKVLNHFGACLFDWLSLTHYLQKSQAHLINQGVHRSAMYTSRGDLHQ